MVSFKLSAALFALHVLGAAAASEPLSKAPPPPDLKIDIDTKFPEADIFGLKLINGKETKAIVEITNHEDAPIRLSLLAGALVNPQPLPEGTPAYASIVYNLSRASYEGVKDSVVEPGQTRGYPYNFALDLQPRDVALEVMAIITNDAGQMFQIGAHSGPASIVEAPTSLLDPQILFLYVFITGLCGATLYFVYKTWIAALFPQAKSAGKVRRKDRKVAKAAEAASADALSGNESTGAGTGAEDFDASWIPAHHINRPVAKRVKSGASKKKAAE